MLSIHKFKTVFITCLLTLSLMLSPGVQAQSTDPASDPMPVINLGGTSKAILTTFSFNSDGSVLPDSVQAGYGFTRLRLGGPPMIQVSLYDDQGLLIEQYYDWDPRTKHFMGPSHGMELDNSAVGVFVTPFRPDYRFLEIRDVDTNQVLATADLGVGIGDFCELNPTDVDCISDLEVTKSGPTEAGAGEQIVYLVLIENVSSVPAQLVELTDTLPTGLSLVSINEICPDPVANILTCELGYLADSSSMLLIINALIDHDLVYNNGGPLTVTNTAFVDNKGGADSNMANNTDLFDTLVIAKADMQVVDVQVPDLPADIIAGEINPITLQTTVNNAGPSWPIDAQVDTTTSTSADALIDPSSDSVALPAVTLNENRVIERTFEISCYSGHFKDYHFSQEVSLVNAADVDPDSSNNVGVKDFSLDCVIPLDIEIRPNNPQKPFNPGSKGVVRLSILSSTIWGLDATTIDPATIKLAEGTAQQTGNGSYVMQTADLNDDGWMDIIVHIETEEMVVTDPNEIIMRAKTFDDITVQGIGWVQIVPNK